MRLGAEIICDALEAVGATVVFGMAGSQNIALFDALRASRLRTVVATSESGAAFAANGYSRASGGVGVLTTIPGPGFTFALSGIAEALLDSAALLWIVPSSGDGTGRPFQQQYLDQPAIARALTKEVIEVHEIAALAPAVARAYQLAGADEPGPVLVLVDRHVLTTAGRSTFVRGSAVAPAVDEQAVDAVARALDGARRVALLVGQGGQAAAPRIRTLAECLGAAVLTTSSGRGVISEEDARSLYYDYGLGGGTEMNRFIERCDVVLALGCKLSHNGSGGFELRIPREKLVHVDRSRATLGGSYPARISVHAEVGQFVAALLPRVAERESGWGAEELAGWRSRLHAEQNSRLSIAPGVLAEQPVPLAAFFEALQHVLPDDSVIVTDSGLHQGFTRGFLRIRSERGLIAPADFQSMGFGVPAAIGAKIAAPDRPVVLVIGDGGMTLSALELMTAVRERLDLTVVILNDGYLNFIRLHQLQVVGRTYGVALDNPDFALLVESLGARHWRLQKDVEATLRSCLSAPGVNVLEVTMTELHGLTRHRLGGIVRRHARHLRRLGLPGSPRG